MALAMRQEVELRDGQLQNQNGGGERKCRDPPGLDQRRNDQIQGG